MLAYSAEIGCKIGDEGGADSTLWRQVELG